MKLLLSAIISILIVILLNLLGIIGPFWAALVVACGLTVVVWMICTEIKSWLDDDHHKYWS